MSCRRFRHDPGPCPVDDTPHTACTPASVGSARTAAALTVPLKRPGWLPTPTATVSAPFTPATYRRAVQGKALGLTRGKRTR